MYSSGHITVKPSLHLGVGRSILRTSVQRKIVATKKDHEVVSVEPTLWGDEKRYEIKRSQAKAKDKVEF